MPLQSLATVKFTMWHRVETSLCDVKYTTAAQAAQASFSTGAVDLGLHALRAGAPAPPRPRCWTPFPWTSLPPSPPHWAGRPSLPYFLSRTFAHSVSVMNCKLSCLSVTTSIARLSVLGEGSLLCCSPWGFSDFSLLKGFSVEFFLSRCEGLRTEDVVTMSCKALWDKLFV